MWFQKRLLRVPWIAGRSNQSTEKEINPEYSLEGLMLMLNLQYFGQMMGRAYHWKRPWCWERLKAGGLGDNRGWDSWMASLSQWTWVLVNSGSWQTLVAGFLQSMGSQRVGHNWSNLAAAAEQLNWTELRKIPWRREWLPIPLFLLGESQRHGALWVMGHGVTKSGTGMSYWHFYFHFCSLNFGVICSKVIDKQKRVGLLDFVCMFKWGVVKW